jgi:hypothetical protein
MRWPPNTFEAERARSVSSDVAVIVGSVALAFGVAFTVRQVYFRFIVPRRWRKVQESMRTRSVYTMDLSGVWHVAKGLVDDARLNRYKAVDTVCGQSVRMYFSCTAVSFDDLRTQYRKKHRVDDLPVCSTCERVERCSRK